MSFHNSSLAIPAASNRDIPSGLQRKSIKDRASSLRVLVLICLCLAVLPGIYIGKLLLNKVSEQIFIRVFRVLLFILAIRIIITQAIKMIGT